MSLQVMSGFFIFFTLINKVSKIYNLNHIHKPSVTVTWNNIVFGISRTKLQIAI